jgi:signal transduction histidine kinase
MGTPVLMSEQAALRRVATLVAHGTPPEQLFRAVIEEVGQLLEVEYAYMGRYEPDGMIAFVASWGPLGPPFSTGSRERIGGRNLVTRVFETGGSARTDSLADASGPLGVAARDLGVRSAVGTPILVEGGMWGVVVAGSTAQEPLPADTEARLASFTELVATAIANAESRAGLARLADEQAALRRVATLVARDVPQDELFAAVTEEIGRLLGVEYAYLGRYDAGGMFTVLGVWGTALHRAPAGARRSLGGSNVATVVFETGRPARMDDYGDASGELGIASRESGVRSAIATPIIVEGRLFGVAVAGSRAQNSLPLDTEARLGSFTELVATAIANAESRAALAASRARIVAAADESRRRIERDLHDGAQQRLVHAVIVLKLAQQAMSNGEANAGELVTEALRHAEEANSELRELAHGILPAALTRGGLRAGIEALLSRVALPVSVEVSGQRLPAGVEATAYFVVSEALTNVVKHAQARGAAVTGRVERGELRVEVCDDGMGGARAGPGTGLGGLEDRVSAIGGRLGLDSPTGGGTRVYAVLPIPPDES